MTVATWRSMPKDGTGGSATAKASGAMPLVPALLHWIGQAAQSKPMGIESGIGLDPADAQISGVAAIANTKKPASTACDAKA